MAHAPVTSDMVRIDEPLGFDEHSEVWDEAPWLDPVRDVPDNATWPRLMSAPHPRAVGSYGDTAGTWVEARRGPWRWWQRLFALRLLEHDDAGQLVWAEAMLTVARQVGKSRGVSDIVHWRVEDGPRVFGEAQDVVCTGKDLAMVRESHRWHRAYALAHRNEFAVSLSNGREGLEHRATGSRTMLRAKDAVYGLSSHLSTVDEAWSVPASVVDDGVVPLMVSVPSSQLLLLSTAHRRATALVIGRRGTALDELGGPEEGPLLVEWSAPADCELSDRAAWRMASPWWDGRRERLIARRLQAVLSGESEDVDEPDPEMSFRSQWLNQWPRQRAVVSKGEQLVGDGEWMARDQSLPYCNQRGVIALEDNFGNGAAVGMCVPVDGVYEVGGQECASWEDAQRLARRLLDLHPGSKLLAGASMVLDSAIMGTVKATPMRRVDTQRALPLFRQLLSEGRIVHDATPYLDAQISKARVVTSGGDALALVPGQRSDLLRCVLWALRAAEHRAPQPAVH